MIEKTISYVDNHEQDFVDTLREAVAIESISAIPDYKESVLKMKDWLKARIESLGFENLQESNYGGYPVVYAEKIIDASKPTVLIYGHYDVQPVDPLELWETSPFDMIERDGKLIGRGAIDDKGMLLTHLFALEALKDSGEWPDINIKLIFEGEEEHGGEEIEKFIPDNKELLKTDYVIVSDTYMVKDNMPGITHSLRGITYFNVELATAKSDLHSGVYGGSVPNPANILMKMIGSLKNDNEVVVVPGFYDDVLDLDEEARKTYADLCFDDEQCKKDLALNNLMGEEGYSTLERRSGRPTLDVNGMWSGFQGEGAKTIIPNHAGVKFSCRLVPNQKADDVIAKIKKHLEDLCPDSVTMNMNILHGGNPWYVPFDNPAYEPVKDAVEMAFGVKPVGLREGGSIPVVTTFSNELEVPCILLALGNPNNNAHAPNEWYSRDYFMKAVKANAYYYTLLGKNS